MTLDITLIRSILAVARAGSFSVAARDLHISQPALTRRIAQAEDIMGVPLFERRPRGILLTDACSAFINHAQSALASIEDGVEAAREAASEGRNEIALAFIETVCDAWMTDAIQETAVRYPGAYLHLAPCSQSAKVSADVAERRVKLGVRYRADPNPAIECAQLFDDPVVVVCGSHHPLAATRKATIEDLAEQQWLGYPAPGEIADAYQGILASRGLSARRLLPINNMHAHVRLASAGFGITLIRRARVLPELQSGALVEIDCPVSGTVPVQLIWRRDAYLGRVSDFLREALLKRFASTN